MAQRHSFSKHPHISVCSSARWWLDRHGAQFATGIIIEALARQHAAFRDLCVIWRAVRPQGSPGHRGGDQCPDTALEQWAGRRPDQSIKGAEEDQCLDKPEQNYYVPASCQSLHWGSTMSEAEPGQGKLTILVVASWTDAVLRGHSADPSRVPEVASRNRRQPRPEHQLVAEHVDRVGLPRPGVTGEPPLAALPVGDLRRVLAELHPVEAFLACLDRRSSCAFQVPKKGAGRSSSAAPRNIRLPCEWTHNLSSDPYQDSGYPDWASAATVVAARWDPELRCGAVGPTIR